jgi:hypothetical protein
MQKRISKGFILVLILFAIIFDVLSFVPILNSIVVVIGQFVMACLFYLAGVNIFKNKPAVMYVLTTIIEFMPAASALPFFLVETLAIIALSRAGRA